VKHLLNQSAVRRLALDTANARQARMNRPPKFWRVSQSFLADVEAAARRIVCDRAAHFQQRGKTLRGGL